MKKRFFLSLLLVTQSSALAQSACPAVKYDWTIAGYADPLAVDSKGNLYGIFTEVSKRSPSGDLLWTYAPSPYLWAIAVDPQDNVYITDNFSGTVDYDPGPEVHALTSKTGTSCLVKLTPDGEYIWARAPADYYIPTRNLTVDRNGDIIAVGEGIDIVVAKVTSDGRDLWHYDYFGSLGNNLDEAQHVATDADNNVYIAGYFQGFINLNPILFGWPDWHDAVDCPFPHQKSFVTKFSPNGDYLWSRSFECNMIVTAMDVYPDGSVIVVGYVYAATDLDPTEGVNLRQEEGMFITKLSFDGSYLWEYFIPTPIYDPYLSLSLLPNGDILVYMNSVSDVDFDPGEGVLQSHCGHSGCWYLLCLDSDANPRWVKSLLHNQSEPQSLAVSASGEIFITNSYVVGSPPHLPPPGDPTLTLDVDPTCGTEMMTLTRPPGVQRFITKLSCITHPGDIDSDGDVDLRDLAAFQNCFEGSDSDTCSPGCDAFDLHPDNALDLLDFSLVSPSVTGPK